ncbi:hypothetical protein Prubr_25020 [Polymorphospora rubra]|uniref:Uncharacterized protein n=1 Tax=Polymorphospora rubra TaxID=338584 RepID=A0A810MWB4_9ACTN|nr:hypothetical protein Prubr_25020 [Polymorphospora rubra]
MGDGAAHLHLWFLARPQGRLQLRGTFLSLWDAILPPIPETQWRENLALVAAWLAEFGGRPLAEPPRIQWLAPSSLTQQVSAADLQPAGSDPEPFDSEPVVSGPVDSEPAGKERAGIENVEDPDAPSVAQAEASPEEEPAPAEVSGTSSGSTGGEPVNSGPAEPARPIGA